ncbi:MAG: diaminopimelate epimerase [Oscillospiraceae bacterium]|nr:diaminopimelate epimerase [Oscillospiraceae bacterium]
MRFYKYCGAGNDFILLDCREQTVTNAPELAKRLCDRHFGVGADGLMLVERPTRGGDCKMLFYNNDGSTAEMCGNGARCISKFCHDFGLSGDEQRIETPAGLVIGTRVDDNRYRVRLNPPRNVRLQTVAAGVTCDYLELGDPGIPHAVIVTDLSQDRESLRQLARKVRYAPEFPRGANINLCMLTGENALRLLTYERGVEDFTLACGTGNGATAAALTLRGLVSGKGTRIQNDGGLLEVDIIPETPLGIDLTGEACLVFTGEIEI